MQMDSLGVGMECDARERCDIAERILSHRARQIISDRNNSNEVAEQHMTSFAALALSRFGAGPVLGALVKGYLFYARDERSG